MSLESTSETTSESTSQPVFTDKIALVTGASRGIGKAIALELGRLGPTIIGTATTEDGAEKITRMLADAGLKGFGISLDLGNANSIEQAIEQLTQKIGAPHILINNAGITADNLALRMREQEWTKVIDTNLSGVFRLIQACLRPMVKQRFGRIVNITSVVGSTGNPGQVNYSAAKAGLIGLTKSLARELGSRGITVNAVAPGFIDTDMTRALSEEQRAKLLEQIPLGRMGDPREVAEAVVFLVSKGAYMTGETLHINGGMFMG